MVGNGIHLILGIVLENLKYDWVKLRQ